MKKDSLWKWLVLSAVLTGCGETGRVQLFVQAEDTIPDGLQPGTGLENIVDGWTVTYDAFLVTIGNFRAGQSASSAALNDARLFVVDMKQLPAGGWVLDDFRDVEATRWDHVGFDLGRASPDAVQPDTTSTADYDRMVNGGLTLYVAGRITKPDGRQCLPHSPADCVARTSVRFTWPLSVPTSFDGCANDSGITGFSVPSGGSVQVKPTIHGDHWFFTNITQGTEITQRRAQWLADADLDRNGETTLDELEAVPASQLLTSTLGYNLSGSLLPSIETVRDYVEAQARTLGDYQGDGECPVRALLQ